MPVSYQVGLDVTNPKSAGDFAGRTILVNTVNSAEGAMGAGVAKAFRERWPDIMGPYRALTSGGHMYGGDLRVLHDGPDVQILGMATKQGWKNPSKNIWVGAGLLRLAHHLSSLPNRGEGVRVLLPKPGCGNGGLDFSEVNRMIRSILGNSGADVIVSVSSESEAEMLSPHSWKPIYAGIGTRDPSPAQGALMRGVGLLAGAHGMFLRSGKAIGSDTFFEDGYRDWQKHPKYQDNGSGAAIYLHTKNGSGDRIGYKPWPAMLGVAERFHDKPLAIGLTADVIEGREEPGDKAALMARNGHQIFGDDFVRITDGVICCTPGGAGGGGTGQAIRMARVVGIPVIDIGSPDMSGATAKGVLADMMALMREREALIKREPVIRAAPRAVVRAADDRDGPDLIERDDDPLADENGNILYEEGEAPGEIEFGGASAHSALSESDRAKRDNRDRIRAVFDSGDAEGAVRMAIESGAATYGAVSLIGGIPATAAYETVTAMVARGDLSFDGGKLAPASAENSPSA